MKPSACITLTRWTVPKPASADLPEEVESACCPGVRGRARTTSKRCESKRPAPLDDDLVECHPLRHLRWTAGVAEENEDSSPLPPQLDFDARNSACRAAAAAGVDWTAVLRRARAYRGGAPVPVVDVLGNWRAADAAALEVVVACACLDRRVAARRGGGTGVTLDFERAAPPFSRALAEVPPTRSSTERGRWCHSSAR